MLYGKWYAKATKKTDLNEAIAMAHRIFMDYEIRAETNTLFDSKRFKDVAEKAIDQMQSELLHGGGKVIYKDYIGALRKYHIPYFDRMFITSIDQEMIREFDKWRIEEFQRIPAKSTIQTQGKGLRRYFNKRGGGIELECQPPLSKLKRGNTQRCSDLTSLMVVE
ncbi:hypothetical protein EKG38_16790 [Shewanella canadensis]|uniref:Uncharacterized protein n=1 Tax=Shewanella canadensis TaxID=271096 RepID=A0A3S0K834_9GAMM|nr:hypothetical protein [Shewanella canadensis]RTR37676.1 hypothetical protein EKG38_16790 [Shewanella canadensis]